jgi:hypothetical protein
LIYPETRKQRINNFRKNVVKTNKHGLVGRSSNLLEVITLDIDLPIDNMFTPVLTCYAYDDLFGFMGKRLIGICNISLDRYAAKIISKIFKPAML